VVYATHPGSGPRQVLAVLEDGSGETATLSAPGVDTSFGGVLPGRAVLLAEHGADGLISRLVRVNADGSGRQDLGTISAPHDGVSQPKMAGTALVVELTRPQGQGTDVLAFSAGKSTLLAANAHLAAVSATTAAVTGDDGNVRAISLDGKKSTLLGAGQGEDRMMQETGGRLLLALGAAGQGDLRVVGADGSSPVDIGQPGVDEQPFAITAGRVVFTRGTGADRSLVSAAVAGGDERVILLPGVEPRPLWATDAGDIVYGARDGSLRLVPAAGGVDRVLDPAAGQHVKVSHATATQVFYTGDTPHWASLRAAALDGSSVAVLCGQTPWVPYFSGLTPDNRAVFYRTLSGQFEGGAVYSVQLDGGDLRPLATKLLDLKGEATSALPVDHDFEAITPRGQIILEAEVEGLPGSRLVTGDASSPVARGVTPTAPLRFKALVP
jgi:hypothetical protein